jgi:hypothetical protein
MGISKYYINCIRQRITETRNSNLRVVETASNTKIKGYIASRVGTNNQRIIADKDTIETLYRFYCNDFNLMFGDLIIYNNKKYEVANDPQNTANKNHHIYCILKLIEYIKQ